MSQDLPRQGPKILFGIHPIKEALAAGISLDKLLITQHYHHPVHKELVQLCRERGITVTKVPVEKLNRVTSKNHQGVIAFLSFAKKGYVEQEILAAFEAGISPLVVVLDGITDVGNFGAIVRTCVATNVTSLVIPSTGAAPLSGDAFKSSAGALAHLSVSKVPQLATCLQYLAKSGLQIIGCHEKAAKSIYELDFTLPTALIFGSEGEGIHPQNLRYVHENAKIPILGKISSLNVSVAAAVILYETIRQRMNLLKL